MKIIKNEGDSSLIMNLIVNSFGDIVISLDEFATFFYMVLDKLVLEVRTWTWWSCSFYKFKCKQTEIGQLEIISF